MKDDDFNPTQLEIITIMSAPKNQHLTFTTSQLSGLTGTSWTKIQKEMLDMFEQNYLHKYKAGRKTYWQLLTEDERETQIFLQWLLTQTTRRDNIGTLARWYEKTYPELPTTKEKLSEKYPQRELAITKAWNAYQTEYKAFSEPDIDRGESLKDIGSPQVKLFLKELLDAVPDQTEFELSYLEAICNLLGEHSNGVCDQCPFEDSHVHGYQSEAFSGTEYNEIPGCKLKECWIPRVKRLAFIHNHKLLEPEHPEAAKKRLTDDAQHERTE